MINQNIVVGVGCAVMLAVVLASAGCSRQQSDWQKTRETNTADAYEQFLKKYPSGEFTAQAQARVKELYEEKDWQKARDADTPEAYQAFLKQYPEGKWTEEARIRVENFTLAQAGSPAGATAGADSSAEGAENTVAAPSAAPPPASKPVPAPTKAAAMPAKPAAAPAAKAKVAAGSYAIQLGAFKSGAGTAHKRWARLQKEYPALLSGLSSKVLSKKTSSGNLYRLQATGLTEKHAREVCSVLKTKSQACVVVPPA
jgi:cell division protein FtsN